MRSRFSDVLGKRALHSPPKRGGGKELEIATFATHLSGKKVSPADCLGGGRDQVSNKHPERGKSFTLSITSAKKRGGRGGACSL